ncbi:uncharacterized protein PITG_15170 [Phytophthora infestans T30-4]|uniref:Apple domain-containing protein n=1 Tax=Phytophthora infestans (strain T30-4) TaxID=403677 RepID=D0NRT7_PHYIT|nr:uncharacterized protein PITG_15170 [Phytophthora infestans T30-4]EEY63437.1 conserved hypothetical protein [Phytophthora infestans T30-4]|eukprot:XP_002898322.1 conserved hypothetical protein [Phytophthora infestans T30-4]
MLSAKVLIFTVGVLAAVAEAAGTCPSIENNVDYSGADVGSARSSSANGCCSICSSTNGCGAFTWTNYNGGTCWLKQSKGTGKASSGSISAVLQTSSSSGSLHSFWKTTSTTAVLTSAVSPARRPTDAARSAPRRTAAVRSPGRTTTAVRVG